MLHRTHQGLASNRASEELRMLLEEQVVLAAAARLDAENPCLDAVLEATVDGPAQFFDSSHRVGRALRERRLREIAPFHREPQPVDSLVCEAVEIGLGVVVDVVHQLVVVEGRALDRSEEAACNAVAHPGLADAWGEIAGAYAVLVVVDGAAKALVVLRRNRDLAVFANVNSVAFAAFHRRAHECDVVRRHMRQGLGHRQLLAERPFFHPRIGRRLGKWCRERSHRYRSRCNVHHGYQSHPPHGYIIPLPLLVVADGRL